MPFAELLSIVGRERPALTLGQIYPDRNGYFYALGQADDWLIRDRANKLSIDPYRGEVIYNQRVSDLSPYWHRPNMAAPCTSAISAVSSAKVSGLSLA